MFSVDDRRKIEGIQTWKGMCDQVFALMNVYEKPMVKKRSKYAEIVNL